jgi:hypothetical protein
LLAYPNFIRIQTTLNGEDRFERFLKESYRAIPEENCLSNPLPTLHAAKRQRVVLSDFL